MKQITSNYQILIVDRSTGTVAHKYDNIASEWLADTITRFQLAYPQDRFSFVVRFYSLNK